MIIGITGNSFEILAVKYPHLVKYLDVIARTSPSQKQLYIAKMKKDEYYPLMCGDGTNDVGALKSASIGIALVGMNDEKTKE